MNKRVSSSRSDYACYQVELWASNDQPVYNGIRDILSGKEKYAPRTPGGDVTERVAAFIEMLLYKDDGSTYRSMHVKTYGHLGGFESHLPGMVRDSFDWHDFNGIDWQEFSEIFREE